MVDRFYYPGCFTLIKCYVLDCGKQGASDNDNGS